ncbi:MAG: hypothetical protein GY867_04530 [bacterium]|nr:hypothetical protein [bacterium]
MSVEKPWEKQFQRLVEDLDAHWGQGEVQESAPNPDVISRSSGGGLWTYPFYRGERGDDTFEWEYQTGNEEFDRKYYVVDARSDKDKMLANNSDFQEIIKQLEPFAAIALSSSGVHLSRAIGGESVMTFQLVDEYLGRLEKLAELAGR